MESFKQSQNESEKPSLTMEEVREEKALLNKLLANRKEFTKSEKDMQRYFFLVAKGNKFNDADAMDYAALSAKSFSRENLSLAERAELENDEDQDRLERYKHRFFYGK